LLELSADPVAAILTCWEELDVNIAQFPGNDMPGGIINKENDPSLFFVVTFN